MITIEQPYSTLAEISGAIKRTERNLSAMRTQQQRMALNYTGPLQEISEILHKRDCKQSHEDMCGYDWETHWETRGKESRWKGSAHRTWLLKAAETVGDSGATPEEYLAALKIVGVS